jgi:hypothetical protein
MLGKMIKHEFRATGRLYIPLFIMVAVLTPILSLLFKLASGIGKKTVVGGILSGISVGGFVLMIVAFSVASFIYIMVRFYKTVATSEAYLTFCLPVNQHHVVLSKLIVGTVWELLTIALSVTSVYVMLIINNILKPGTVTGVLKQIVTFVDGSSESLFVYLLKFGIIMFISMISSTLSWYLAICLGQLFNEHRVIMSIAMYIGIYMAVQILSMVIIVPILLGSSDFVVGQVSAFKMSNSPKLPAGFFALIGGLNAALGVVYYIASTQILKKKTNVR